MQTFDASSSTTMAVAEGVVERGRGGSASRSTVTQVPQTHLMWRHGRRSSADHTVICPDLRGYGTQRPSCQQDRLAYAKRTMAADVVARPVLGHEGLLVGHDRGALVALRAA